MLSGHNEYSRQSKSSAVLKSGLQVSIVWHENIPLHRRLFRRMHFVRCSTAFSMCQQGLLSSCDV